VALLALSIILCGPFGLGTDWLIGRRLPLGVGVVAAGAALVAWFVVGGVVITEALGTQRCTDCNDAGWAFLIFDPLTTLGFLVGLVPGIVIGRRARTALAPTQLR
jgi:hypothetical protein